MNACKYGSKSWIKQSPQNFNLKHGVMETFTTWENFANVDILSVRMSEKFWRWNINQLRHSYCLSPLPPPPLLLDTTFTDYFEVFFCTDLKSRPVTECFIFIYFKWKLISIKTRLETEIKKLISWIIGTMIIMTFVSTLNNSNVPPESTRRTY